MSNTKIVLNKQSDLILNDAQIINPVGIEKVDLPGLVDDLSALQDADLSLESKLSIDLSTEAAERAANDLSLQNQIDFITSNMDDAAIDSLTEIVAAFQAADGDLNGAITELANSGGAGLSAEISNRIAGDNSLETLTLSLNEEQQNYINTLDSVERAARIAADSSLETLTLSLNEDQQNYINTQDSLERAARIAADSSLETLTLSLNEEQQNYINTQDSLERAARIAADSSLETLTLSLNEEQQNYINTQDSLERAARIDGDSSLETLTLSLNEDQQNYINTQDSLERAARIDSDSSLEVFINAEKSVINNLIDFRSASLEASISVEQSKIVAILDGASTELDQFVEIVNYINSLDEGTSTDLLNAIASLEVKHNSEMSVEVDFRAAGDANIQSEIDAMPSTDETTIEVDAVDNVIRLKDTVAAPASGVRTFVGDVKASVQPDTLESYDPLSFITKGILDVTIADLDAVSTDLSTEVSRAQGVEAAIQEQLDAMPSTDNATVEVDSEFNVIRLTETIAAPISGVRTFVGDVKASVQPDTLESYDPLSFITKGILDVTITDLNAVSTDLSSEVVRAEAAEAALQAQLDAMPSTDETTLEVNGDTNVIKLKDTVAAPASGVRTFEGDVKAGVQPDDLESYDALSYITKQILEEAVSAEAVLRAEADAELDVRIVDIISNTDFSSTDSFTELIAKVNEVTADNFDSIYAKKVEVTFDEVSAVTLATPVKAESMMLYINGLMVDNGDDYTETIVDGYVVGATLIGDALAVAAAGAKLNAYGVHGTFTNISFSNTYPEGLS